MGQKTRDGLLLYTGSLLIFTVSIIGLALPTIRWYVLFLIVPILPAFGMAIYMRRDLGALAIGIWLLSLVILTLVNTWSYVDFSNSVITLYLFVIMFTVGLILIMVSLRPERGHVRERTKTTAVVILLLGIILGSFLYPPSVKVSLKVSDTYIFYHLILLFVLPLLFTLAWIIQAYGRKRVQELLLSESWINISLAMLTMGMFSISVFIFSAFGVCSCGCIAYISPGVAIVTHSLIVPSSALLTGHIFANKFLNLSKRV